MVLIDGFLTKEAVQETRQVLTDSAYCPEIVDHNFQIAERFFSYSRLEVELRAMMAKPQLDSQTAA